MTAPPTVSEGGTGPAVRSAQYLLVRRTLSYTQIDGTFGPETKKAVEQFQGEARLAVDGIVGPATWSALGGERAEPPTLAGGSRGPVVEKLQTALNEGRGSSRRNPIPCSPSTAYTALRLPSRSRVPSSRARSPTTGWSACRRGRCPCTQPARCSPMCAT
jgi:hypothetical protein